jgi:hypothetical protein
MRKTKMRIMIENKCCCCGGVVKAEYTEGDEVGKALAEACDVCVACFNADCRVLTGRRCKVTGKKQVQLSK